MSTKGHSAAERLAEELHSAAIHLLRSLRRVDEASGITGPRLSALSVVVFRGSITLGKLAEAEQVRPPTMTRIVNALEEIGLVMKMKDRSDGRILHISATHKGKRALVEGRRRRVRLLAEQIDTIDEVEQVRLSSALGVIRGVIGRMR